MYLTKEVSLFNQLKNKIYIIQNMMKNNELHIFVIFLPSMKMLEREESILKGDVRRQTW